MRPKVFITGGSGLLALNWASAIQNCFSVILGLHKREIFLAGIESQRIDLDSVENIIRVFEQNRCELVIHTVGLTNVEECETKPDLARHINVELATNVAKACAKLGLQLVHVSTDHLFSGKDMLVDEAQPISPINVYGRTKAEAEYQVLQAHSNSLVIRTNFYGWGPVYRRSFSDLIIDGLRSGRELVLFKDVFYTPILIEEVAQATHELLKLKANGIFNMVGDERISKYDFGINIAQTFNLNKRLIKLGSISEHISLVQRPHDMSLSNQKICSLLGRRLGKVNEHIFKLHQQELRGFSHRLNHVSSGKGSAISVL
jgi:dTDP-4-dehydrorhamnose reductase